MALFIRWVHILSAITWVGGMLFIAARPRQEAPNAVALFEH